VEILTKYGADALRLYLINSPVVRAEPLRFREDGVFAVVKDVFLPWYNAYRFLVQNVLRLEAETGTKFDPAKVTNKVLCGFFSFRVALSIIITSYSAGFMWGGCIFQ
jgi:isoleucyl-tRNA synthetase